MDTGGLQHLQHTHTPTTSASTPPAAAPMSIPMLEATGDGVVVVTGEEPKNLTCSVRRGSACRQSGHLLPNNKSLEKAELI